MPIDFSRRMKGALTQTLVKSLLEDANYRVVSLGIEEVMREIAALEQPQYLGLRLPKALRSLPDFLVTDSSIAKAWLVEVKYRRRWDADAIQSLRDKLLEQAGTWGPFFLLLFLGEHAGDFDTPANRCGIFELRVDNGNLQYRGRYAPYNWYPWNNAEWQYASKPTAIFEALDETAQDKTIQKCCDFAASYPGVLDGT